MHRNEMLQYTHLFKGRVFFFKSTFVKSLPLLIHQNLAALLLLVLILLQIKFLSSKKTRQKQFIMILTKMNGQKNLVKLQKTFGGFLA